ncbi:MAG: toxin-antitoxin system HicB family antitoxin [Prevotellaceae bacterium]|jgi:hypothetical protein|nr:toxin-antitoxin system HicB family antitoxin [Prevotellaceae bacterium]
METIATKKQTAFRLSPELVNRLKVAAKREHRSLNNFVENILTDALYNEPNEVTKKAINEAKSGKFAGTIHTESMEAFLKSCEE